MQLVYMVLAIAGITAADQLLKWWVVENIQLLSRLEMIPGLFHLTYVRNTGAAFSMMQGMRWLFVVIFVVFTVLLIFEYRKQSLGLTKLEWWCVAAMYAGGLGNVIDRVRLGYVVDMIEVEFIRFPIFNLADCFITCGAILLIVHLVFFNRNFWRDGKA